MLRINIFWDGPHTYHDILELRDKTDYGLYQMAGPNNALLYIGKANTETFRDRFKQADHSIWDFKKYPWEDNTRLMRFFTGRIHAGSSWPSDDPDYAMWERAIDLAERLLIAAHGPPWNKQFATGIPEKKAEDFDDCHVLNWGNYGLLLPEVSGVRHSWVEWNRIKDKPLKTTE